MDEIGKYILSVLSAAIVTAIVIRISAKNQVTGNIIKMFGGIFLIITAISPLISFRVQALSDYIESVDLDAEKIIEEAQSDTENALQAIISEQVRSYVMNKAETYGAEISVSVSITEPSSLVPDTITIEGEVSPYQKELLKEAISVDLGIQEDKQIWK